MIPKEEVEKLAELSRLTLQPGEVETLQKDISRILEYVGQVTAAQGDASDEARVSGLRNVMREDVPHTSDSPVAGKREAVLGAFPKREGDYNVVRKIIQKDE